MNYNSMNLSKQMKKAHIDRFTIINPSAEKNKQIREATKEGFQSLAILIVGLVLVYILAAAGYLN